MSRLVANSRAFRNNARDVHSLQRDMRVWLVRMSEAVPQFLWFCFVGVVATALDFAIFNVLTRRAVGWHRIPANIVSVAIAMTWTFLANWFLVFHPQGDAWLPRAGRFLATTAFSAFVLQNLVLYFTSYVWRWPSNLAQRIVVLLRQRQRFSEDMISRNTCKVLAVGTGMIWNFCWYKFYVYAR